MSIRIAVIGAGIMGEDHARIIAQDLPGATLHVVCDASSERAKLIADRYGAADVSTDPLFTLSRSDVDAIIIASPDETHAGLTMAAIEAGKPALCEKPLSQSPDQCLAVIDREMSQGRHFVQLGFMRRFDPSYREMKNALSDGVIGRAVMMHNFHRNVEAPANFSGQMAISNSAPHEFDVARHVLDTEYVAISVFQPAHTSKDGVGAPVFMVLETREGQLVNIEINNNAHYGYDVRGELVGEQGSVQLATPVHARFNTRLQGFEKYAADWRPRFADAYRLQNKAFVEFINTGIFPAFAANAWDGYCAAVVAQAGIEALNQRRRVVLPTLQAPPFYQPHEGATS
ncbi:Gfo/Idh/MocA family oxidoreductase [Pseudomonas rhodesiae]|uniref:Myo-inositol 2-dehydrogenase / D-chiro-inositol 1-dehydrogenase n=1 Tax=Pseudomonas rhodesiae TaxID=76760 RepID=A0AAE8HBJ4_9PSED|nr:Gfo/Idh/MocA family oxidoreductase [Pseudomonas rhodesiae]ROM54567.1 myo-inositol 2-dehydrogenase [Pseudomonas rhodesiae]ROM64771.1 myo-inositol 2-dehydrogenase [Pseudomonas rhodesiae]TWR52935.1 myo-inositol 2-dehydrogenase [Pseudomonas rhodesiae]SDV03251.1 myo-inositol 2-dehydrogenase / D-chiro-inositol 1-dehydrogenase [Pseudomonas rhodesiae]